MKPVRVGIEGTFSKARMYVCTYICVIRAPCLLIFSLIRNVEPTGQNRTNREHRDRVARRFARVLGKGKTKNGVHTYFVAEGGRETEEIRYLSRYSRDTGNYLTIKRASCRQASS